MNMSTVSRSRVLSTRVQSELRDSEARPNLAAQLDAMTIPSIDTTPRGPLMSNYLKRKIGKLRVYGIWGVLLMIIGHKKERGVPAHVNAAPFELAAALCFDPPKGVRPLDMSAKDGALEAESRAAWEAYHAEKSEVNKARVRECEAREIAVSRAAIAMLS
jgi:hypothetical protein